MKEFLGVGGYSRPVEGYLSWQHLLFVSLLMVIMVILAVVIGKNNKNKADKEKNRVLIFTAIIMDSFETIKIVLQCIINKDPLQWLYSLPLFLCSIQFLTLPLAAFSKGRLREASLDFVCIFGLLGAVLGTYFAGNNYSSYPVISLQNVVSGITHTTAGFASLYIIISKMVSMKKKNMIITFAILFSFCVAAYAANIFLDYNYMFLTRGDGTPYDILYNLVGGSNLWYPLSVVLLFIVYIFAYYNIYYLFSKKSNLKAKESISVKL